MTEKEISGLIGNRIAQLRKEAGYASKSSFAYNAKISSALYCRYEKGANLTINSLYRILKYHKVTFKEFFKEGFQDL